MIFFSTLYVKIKLAFVGVNVLRQLVFISRNDNFNQFIITKKYGTVYNWNIIKKKIVNTCLSDSWVLYFKPLGAFYCKANYSQEKVDLFI